MAGFRKSHSTSTLLLKIRDDILRAMSKGELTLSVYSDCSKAFDTVQHHTIIQKLHKIGFSTSALKWFISYLRNRSQYVQVNDYKSVTKPCHFGVPQGSVLRPLLLFNLYLNDLQDIDPADPVNTCQYADVTTQYEHFKISQIRQTIQNPQKRLDNYKKLFVLKKIKRFAPQKSRKHLAEGLIISKIDYGNIIYSNASQNSLIRLQKLLKVTRSFVNGRNSNSLNVILLGCLPINERIDFRIIKLAHKAFYVTPFPSYLKLSFKKLPQYLRNKDK